MDEGESNGGSNRLPGATTGRRNHPLERIGMRTVQEPRRLEPERIGAQAGFHRSRQRPGGAELSGRCCGATGRSSTTTCWSLRRSIAARAAARSFLEARNIGAASLDLELVDAVGSQPIPDGARVVAAIEVQGADVGEQTGVADRVEGGFEQGHVVAVGAVDHPPDRDAVTSAALAPIGT
jgi:hypothetical protein